MTNPLLLKSYLKTLRLPAISAHYEEIIRDAMRSNLNYEEFLLALASIEVSQRDINRRNRLIRKAGFPFRKLLSDYQFSSIAGLNERQILQLAGCEYVARKENIIFIGDGGTGKTHLSIGLGICACEKDYDTAFYTVAGLINQMLESRTESRLSRLIKRISRLDLLILDELGCLPIDKEGANLLFQALSERNEKGSTIITSNLAFSDWGEVFPSDRSAGALIDRLTHHCHIIEMYGDSYRFKEGLSKRGKPADPNQEIKRSKKEEPPDEKKPENETPNLK
jgi:DNA replication protein DnaC